MKDAERFSEIDRKALTDALLALRTKAVNALLEAAQAVVAFNESDSLLDQQTDPRLREEAHAAMEALRLALARIEETPR
jgi:hypothetical protein